MKDYYPYTALDYRDISDDLNKLCRSLVLRLSDTTFYENAASYKYHHVYVGGLADHSMEMYFRLRELVKNEGLNYNNSTLFLISIGHDLDKLSQYRFNAKTDSFDFVPKSRGGRTHGENSFYILENYLNGRFKVYKDYELIKICIQGHMGEMDKMIRAREYWLANKDICRLLVLTHEADAYSCEIAKDLNDNN